MTGLYIHIPFCASRCVYCGFYSTTRHALIGDYLGAIAKEMQLRKREAEGAIRTVYIGGGTPSQLTVEQVEHLLCSIEKTWELTPDVEITMECNPEDITEAYAAGLARLPVNRVSLGVQTFSDKQLRFLRRRHDSRQAQRAIERLRKAGFGNISIDLMFGFPTGTITDWEDDLRHALQLEVEHISAYSLMYEADTPLHNMLQQGKIRALDDDACRQMFELLINRLEDAGYEHYEISNFAKPKRRSRHNSSYWQGLPYIGIGAAAHSYDKVSRQWNVANLREYMQGIETNNRLFERETLDRRTRYNDLITTALRTREGIFIRQTRDEFGENYARYLLECAERSLSRHLLAIEGDRLHLTREGIFVSNDVMSDLIALETPE